MKYFLRWLPSMGWMGVIYYLSSRTGSELQGMFPFVTSFNAGHLIAYFILSLLFYWALYPMRERLKFDIRLFCIVLSFLYGLTDEWHQGFVPTRTPDLLDVVNDVIGATLAMLFVTYVRSSSKGYPNKYQRGWRRNK